MNEPKPIRLSPKRGGHGHVTSYSVNIGSAEAREVGFLDASNEQLSIEKVIDTENHCVIIRLASKPSE